MILGTLGASLLGNVLAGKGINRSGEAINRNGNKKQEHKNKIGF